MKRTDITVGKVYETTVGTARVLQRDGFFPPAVKVEVLKPPMGHRFLKPKEVLHEVADPDAPNTGPVPPLAQTLERVEALVLLLRRSPPCAVAAPATSDAPAVDSCIKSELAGRAFGAVRLSNLCLPCEAFWHATMCEQALRKQRVVDLEKAVELEAASAGDDV